MAKQERSLSELYGDDPERGDALAFGRRTDSSRRGFLGGAGLAAMGAAVGGTIPFSDTMPGGLIPAAMAQSAPPAPPAPSAGPAAAAPKGPQLLDFPGKAKGLVLLGDRPLVAETPEHMLDDDTTPFEKFYVRNNGQTPEPFTEGDAWELTIDGEVNTPLKIKLGELKQKFTHKTFRMVLECGGNGRSFFQPQARGNQWTNGGAGCAEWTGVPLADVLQSAGLKSTAVHTGNYGADQHLSGDATKDAISRGVPIAAALEPHALLVWGMNGQPLPAIHGGPLRVIIPGFPASVSHKWLKRIAIRDRVHDGQGMGGTSYSVAIKPMIPGGKTDDANMRTMTDMPVRGIITNPANGTRLPAGTRKLALRGAAWDGHEGVSRVDVSIDFGATWQPAKAAEPKNRYDWRRWTTEVELPSDGYYELWVRATDSKGRAQPHVAGGWNPQGYGANPMHRVAVLVG
ncbi:Tat (twin-arginine translocation) pathway signal sequence [Bosea sp. CRIB-10]|uniref:sulfite oxidase n=1 Tax=Bosea sp. CRIB-10 TaxID=378404 RepID=UPI0008F320F9|nr:sulfite oxidase [Bosea sp. CRIB-10]SFC88908.1 Tat (twin-arginine translocation) pathway signal sequence [Bosea sp. CRIB-10]